MLYSIQNTEWLRFEGGLWRCSSLNPCSEQAQVNQVARAMSHWVLNVSKDEEFITLFYFVCTCVFDNSKSELSSCLLSPVWPISWPTHFSFHELFFPTSRIGLWSSTVFWFFTTSLQLDVSNFFFHKLFCILYQKKPLLIYYLCFDTICIQKE